MVRDWRDELGELGLPHVPEDLLQDGEAGLDVGSHIVQLEQDCGAKGAAIRAGERRGNELVDALGGVRGREPLGEATDDEDRSLEILLWGIGEQLTAVRHDLGNDLGELSSLEQGLALLHYLAVSIADQARHQLGDRDDRVLLAHLHEHTGRRAHLSSHARNTGVAHYVYARLTLDATPAR